MRRAKSVRAEKDDWLIGREGEGWHCMDATASPLRPTVEMVLSALEAAKKTIAQLNEYNLAHKVLEDWHEDMLNHMAAEVWINAGRMFALFERMELNLSTLAYVVRNLLEINVWIEYSCKSKLNAKRFYEDKYRDGLGLQKAMTAFIKAIPNVPSGDAAELQSMLTRVERAIRQAAATAGMSSLDLDYKRVVEAANELGSKDAFIALNTFLSKFAHPTAFTVLSFFTGDALTQPFLFLFLLGLLLVLAACNHIKEYVVSLGVDVT